MVCVIVALISCLNVVNSGYQVAFMAPTEILAYQHYKLAQSLIKDKMKIGYLTSKTDDNLSPNLASNPPDEKLIDEIMFGLIKLNPSCSPLRTKKGL